MALPHDPPSPPALSLYERLGGASGIATVVDILLDRMEVNPVLNANPAIANTHQREARAMRQYLVTALLGWATGGPQQYVGRSMRDAHAHLCIREVEWQAFVADAQASLTACAVPAVEQGELLALVSSLKPEIVQTQAAAA